MSTVTTIGLDIAKSVFQVHGISATGEVLITGHVSCRASAMRSGSCRRPMSNPT
jgi:hypothetical protein